MIFFRFSFFNGWVSFASHFNSIASWWFLNKSSELDGLYEQKKIMGRLKVA